MNILLVIVCHITHRISSGVGLAKIGIIPATPLYIKGVVKPSPSRINFILYVTSTTWAHLPSIPEILFR